MSNRWTKYTRRWNIFHTKRVIHNIAIYYIKIYESYPSGFGDTSGPEKDKQIIDDIKATFAKKLTKIDEVWFVAQSSNVR